MKHISHCTALVGAIVMLLALLSGSGAMKQAHAGTWTVSYLYNGQDESDTPDTDFPSPTLWPTASPDSLDRPTIDMYADDWDNDVCTMHSQGTVQAVFTWHPDTGEATPSTLWIQETSSAWAAWMIEWDNPDPPQFTGGVAASDGLGDPAITDPPGTPYGSWGSGSYHGVISSGKRLTACAVSAQGVAYGPVRTLSAQGTTSVEIWKRVNVSYSATPSNRSLSISSPTIEPSYRRTTDTSLPLSKYRNNTPPSGDCTIFGNSGAGLLNERNSDGSMTVDSVAIWDGPSQQWMGQGTFESIEPNFASPTRVWTIGGGTLIGDAETEVASGHPSITIDPGSDQYYALHGLMLGGSITGSGMMSNSIVNLSVIDNDGAVAHAAPYTVNWHLPYEKLGDLPDGPHMKDVFDEVGRIDDAQSANVTLEAKDFDYNAAIDDVLVIGEAAGLPTEQAKGLWAAFKAVMNLSQLDLTQPSAQAEQITVVSTSIPHNSDAFKAAVDNRPENIRGLSAEDRQQMIDDQDYSTWDHYDCYAFRVRYHHQQNAMADKYDVHGFHSPDHVLSADITEKHGNGDPKIDFETFYVLIDAPPPTLGDKDIDAALQSGGIQ